MRGRQKNTPVTEQMAASVAHCHTGQNNIVMVGAFPPPVHGMAAVNAAVRDLGDW